jgi:hypothetical protein
VAPLNWDEWKIVLWFSLPVLLVEEILKAMTRFKESREFALARAKQD